MYSNFCNSCTIRYDTRCYFNVRSKADISQLNLIILSVEIASNCPVTWSAENCSIPSIYVVLAYLQELVENEREAQYEFVIAELARLYETVGDVLPFKIYARLIIALKILVKCCQN